MSTQSTDTTLDTDTARGARVGDPGDGLLPDVAAGPAHARTAASAPTAGAPANPPTAGAPANAAPVAGETRTYRARTVEELIPRIQAELGADAIVVRREKGLTGGVGGFFQRPYVEVEARAGTPRVNRYDSDGAAPALPPALERATAEPTSPASTSTPHASTPAPHASTPAPHASSPAFDEPTAASPAAPPPAIGISPSHELLQETFRELTPASLIADAGTALPAAPNDDPFAAALARAEADLPDVEPAIAPRAATLPTAVPPAATVPQAIAATAPTAVPRGRARQRIEESLLGYGMGEALVAELVETAATHLLPVMPGRTSLARAVHRALCQRIPGGTTLPTTGAAVALAGAGGSGKSACCAALVDAYRARGALPAACATLAAGQAREDLLATLPPHVPQPLPMAAPELARALRAARAEGVLLLDLPALSPADRGAIRAQAALLQTLKPDRVVLALPATLSARAAARLLEALAPLGPSALAITHTDETDQLGVAVEAACRFGLAPEYLLDRGHGRAALTQIDPAYLADRLLP
jgi:flagellar biosynthesis protein FlhF